MKMNQMFPSRYMKADDVPTPTVLTVARVDIQTLGTGPDAEEKPVITWAEQGYKPLVTNLTNALVVADLAGDDDSDNWDGTQVEAYKTRVQFGRKMVDAVRLRAPKGVPATSPQPASPPGPPVQDGFDDANATLNAEGDAFDDVPFDVPE